MSGRIYNLESELKTMQEIGVDIVRVSPEPKDTFVQIERFVQAQLKGSKRISLAEQGCNGYWFGKPGRDVSSGNLA